MSLVIVEIIFGTICVALGSAFVFETEKSQVAYRIFLRSKTIGVILFSFAGLWFLFHIATLGESDFGEYKLFFFLIFSVVILVALAKLQDFLSVRGAAILFLLSANEFLKAARMEPYISRLIMVTGVYIGILLSMLYGVAPYKLRDHLDGLFHNRTCAQLFGVGLTIYGLVELTTIFW